VKSEISLDTGHSTSNAVVKCSVLSLFINRTVARKFSIGGLCICAGGLDIIKLTKIPHIYSGSRFHLGGLGALFGPPKTPVATGPFINQRSAECVSLYFVSAGKNTLLLYVTVCEKVVQRLNKHDDVIE